MQAENAMTPKAVTAAQIRIGSASAMPEGTATASVSSAVTATAARHIPSTVRYELRNSDGRERGSEPIAALPRMLYIQAKAAMTHKSVNTAESSTQGRAALRTV